MLARTILAALLLASPLALAAEAQGLGVRYSHRFENANLSVSLRTGGSSHGYGRPAYRKSYRGPSLVRSAHSYRRSYRRTWVDGCWTVVDRRVWVPGCHEKVWVDPVYEVVYDECGNRVRTLVREGYWSQVFRPGHYVVKQEKVWRPGYWR